MSCNVYNNLSGLADEVGCRDQTWRLEDLEEIDRVLYRGLEAGFLPLCHLGYSDKC